MSTLRIHGHSQPGAIKFKLLAAYTRRLNAICPFKDADRLERVVPMASRHEFERIKERIYELMTSVTGWERDL